jgi:catechol 2,3-dioxygenase-like lactoylglutathione lyase family enzyme
MYLSHICITIPKGSERAARDFYVNLLGLREVSESAGSRKEGGLWLEAGGIELHLIVEEPPAESPIEPHLGLGCGDLASVKSRLEAAGIMVQGRTGERKFWAQDPFGNRLEIHTPGTSPL